MFHPHPQRIITNLRYYFLFDYSFVCKVIQLFRYRRQRADELGFKRL